MIKLRVPALAEVATLAKSMLGLFNAATSVNAALVELTRAADRLQVAAALESAAGKAAADRCAELRRQANQAEGQAAAHRAEEKRAIRVREKLADLLA